MRCSDNGKNSSFLLKYHFTTKSSSTFVHLSHLAMSLHIPSQ